MQSLWFAQSFRQGMSEKLNTTRNSGQGNRINNVETAGTTEQNTHSENQNVNYINYNEQFNSDHDSSDDNYVETVENVSTMPIALQYMTITNGNTDCQLLLDSSILLVVVLLSICHSPGK